MKQERIFSLLAVLICTALPKKWCGGKRQANTGSAGALARNEREARNSYSVKGLRLSVLRARAPALPVITGSFQIGSTFWAKPLARFLLQTVRFTMTTGNVW